MYLFFWELKQIPLIVVEIDSAFHKENIWIDFMSRIQVVKLFRVIGVLHYI